jgi:hypothetical protein
MTGIPCISKIKWNIVSAANALLLPTAHTCFLKIDVFENRYVVRDAFDIDSEAFFNKALFVDDLLRCLDEFRACQTAFQLA